MNISLLSSDAYLACVCSMPRISPQDPRGLAALERDNQMYVCTYVCMYIS